jgi:hypothetical protein
VVGSGGGSQDGSLGPAPKITRSAPRQKLT